MESGIEAAVGMSRKWDAREAGRETAETTIQNLSRPPNFFLLFSTIHYEKYGGFQEFLDGVWDVLPKGTPLVGGTVAGFMNNKGAYARGASSIAVSYPNMDVSVSCCKNIKRKPVRSTDIYTNILKDNLTKSTYENKFLLNLISGAELFNFPGEGQKKIIRSKSVSRVLPQFLKIIEKTTDKGFPKDDEILNNISKKLPDYSFLSGILVDDFKFLKNYQFYNDQVLNNNIVGMGLKTDIPFDVNTTHCMEEKDIHFKITKVGYGGRIIKEINNKPAWPEFLRLLNWDEETLMDEARFTKRMIYHPFGIKRDGRIYPAMTALVLGDYIMTAVKSNPGEEVSILNISGKLLLNAVKENLQKYSNLKPYFGIFSSCVTRLLTLGSKTKYVQNELKNYFQEKPFLVFYVSGEGTYSSKEKKLIDADMSFNSAIFGEKLT